MLKKGRLNVNENKVKDITKDNKRFIDISARKKFDCVWLFLTFIRHKVNISSLTHAIA